MEVSNPSFSGSHSRSEQDSGSDSELSVDDACVECVEVFAQSILATSPVSSDGTSLGHGAEDYQPPRKKKTYEQKYKAKWEKEQGFRGWLKPVKGDPKRAYCSACKRELMAKRSVLTLHAHSDGHDLNVCRLTDPHIITLEQLNGFGSNSIPRQVKEAELKLAGFLAEHNLPFQLMDHLSELLSSVCPTPKLLLRYNTKGLR